MRQADQDSFWGVILGNSAASSGGKARAKSLSPERRKQIARKAANARWSERVSTPDGTKALTASINKCLRFGA